MRLENKTQPYEPLDVRLAREAARVDALLAQLQDDFEERSHVPIALDEFDFDPCGFELL